MITDSVTQEQFIVVSGGWFEKQQYFLNSTEILDKEGIAWRPGNLFDLLFFVIVKLIVAILFEGPDLPDATRGHSSITLSTDLVVVGGEHYVETANLHWTHKVYMLKCKNGTFKWSLMDVQLKTPRSFFVASLIPASY